MLYASECRFFRFSCYATIVTPISLMFRQRRFACRCRHYALISR